MNIGNVFRSRAQNVPLPHGVKRHKMRRMRMGDIGIIGCRQTGRSTLAWRFSAMDDGPFQDEVPSRFEYRAFVDLDNREVNGTGDLFLTIYVIPAPSDLPEPNPFFYIQEMFNFSAMILLCSVIERETLEAIAYVVNFFNEPGLPYYLIVGNKKDLNRETFPHHFTTEQALMAMHNFGASYFECSAKQNIDVTPILDEILRQVIIDDPE